MSNPIGGGPGTPQQGTEVTMNCRSRPDVCPGKRAKITVVQRRSLLQGGGIWIRYRCLTCNGVWSITR